MPALQSSAHAATSGTLRLRPKLGKPSFLSSLRATAYGGALRALAPLHPLFGSRIEQAVGILMYHRVAPHEAGVPRPTHNVTPRRFRQQLAGLLQRGFVAWPLRKVLEHHRQGEAIPREVFAVTFDDGHASNYHYAWPVLKELRIPATIFLATAYLDSQDAFPFDDWEAAGSHLASPESWLPLSTAQCLEMLDSAWIELGAHTHSHADFRDEPVTFRDDLYECLGVLRDRFGYGDATFAFPYGKRKAGFAGEDLAEVARELGLLCGLTTESELVLPKSDRFAWGRFTADERDTAATLAVKLSGWYSTMRDLWQQRPAENSVGASLRTP